MFEPVLPLTFVLPGADEAFAKLPPITEAYAKARILNANYTKATDFARPTEGWTADAQKIGKPVSLLVNDLDGVNTAQN